MLDNAEGVQKLKEFLKKKGLQGEEVEIERIAQNLYELGLFLVRLKIKEHSKPSKTSNVEGFELVV